MRSGGGGEVCRRKAKINIGRRVFQNQLKSTCFGLFCDACPHPSRPAPVLITLLEYTHVVYYSKSQWEDSIGHSFVKCILVDLFAPTSRKILLSMVCMLIYYTADTVHLRVLCGANCAEAGLPFWECNHGVHTAGACQRELSGAW